MESKQNFFEKHPRWTLLIINGLILGFVYGVLSIKVFNNDWTEHEPKNLKTIILQKYFGAIIDKNVGRFIKLREFRPNADFKERPSQFYIDNVAPNTLERKYYRIRTDENGFLRGTRRAHATPDIKIYFLGGSTTECLYMEEDERFPVRVEQSLEASLHKKVNVYNGGVSANESMHSLNILMNKVLPHKPNIVVLMHNINDLVMLRTQGTYDY